MNEHERQGFLGRLFDFSFDHFVVTGMIKVLYGLAIFVAGRYGLMTFIALTAAGFQKSAGMGVLGLLGGAVCGPLVFLLMVVCSRIYLEVLIVIFRIAEHTEQIASRGGLGGIPTATPPTAPPPAQ